MEIISLLEELPGIVTTQPTGNTSRVIYVHFKTAERLEREGLARIVGGTKIVVA